LDTVNLPVDSEHGVSYKAEAHRLILVEQEVHSMVSPFAISRSALRPAILDGLVHQRVLVTDPIARAALD
jgi:hypothetical protein